MQKSVNCANSSIDVADVVLTALLVVVVLVPTRTVGTRALTLAVFATLARLLIYSGELTVFVCTKDARAVFALFCVWADARVVTPGVVPVVVTRVERTVVDGRLATVFVAVARALRVADASRAADARTAVDVVAGAFFYEVETTVLQKDAVDAETAHQKVRRRYGDGQFLY